MSPLHADLLTVLDSVEILTATSYRLLDREVRDLEADAASSIAASPVDTPLMVSTLAMAVYAQLYIRPTTPGRTRPDLLAQRDLVAALSAANTGQGTWEPGWRIVEVDDDDRVAVIKDAVIFWVPRSGLRTSEEQVVPGQFCRVRVAKELRNLMAGYYVAVGDGDVQDGGDDTTRLVRFYWHVTAAGAIPFIGAVSSTLNRLGIPFRAKVLSDPVAYQRADAGVLYLDQRDYEATRHAIAEVHRVISPYLRPEIPLFTKPLAPGLSLAEDPGNGSSFGQHRCQLIAQALWQSFTRSDRDRDAHAATLARVFQQAGLNPCYPYLEPRSVDRYTLYPELAWQPT